MSKKPERTKERVRIELMGMKMIAESVRQMLEQYEREAEALQAELDEIEFQECVRK